MRRLATFLLLVLLAAPAAAEPADTLKAQVEAWNRGDLGAFMQGYLDSPELSYTAAGEIVQGYAALEERYRARYGKDSASMGRLEFRDLAVQPLDPDHALVVGRWHLEQAPGTTYDGVFSLVMKRVGEAWRILHDHSSVRPPAPKP